MPKYTHFLPKHYVTALVAGERLEGRRNKPTWRAADVMGEVLRMETDVLEALERAGEPSSFEHGDLQMAQTTLDRALIAMARRGPGGTPLLALEEGTLQPRRTNVYRLTQEGRSRASHELMNLAVRPHSPYPSRMEILEALLGPRPTPEPALAPVPISSGFSFCPYCGAKAVEGGGFCWQCGKPLSPP